MACAIGGGVMAADSFPESTEADSYETLANSRSAQMARVGLSLTPTISIRHGWPQPHSRRGSAGRSQGTDAGISNEPLAQGMPAGAQRLACSSRHGFLLLIAITTPLICCSPECPRSRERCRAPSVQRSPLASKYFSKAADVVMATVARSALRAALRVIVLLRRASRARKASSDARALRSASPGAAIAVIATAAVLWSTRRTTTVATLRESGRGQSPGRQQLRARGFLLVAQTALTTVLLIGTALLARSFVELLNVDPGFNADGAIAVQVSQPWTQDAGIAATRRAAMPD